MARVLQFTRTTRPLFAEKVDDAGFQDMTWETFLEALGMDAVKRGFRTIRGSVSKTRYRKLLAAAVSELLRLDPDINAAEANILAAEALGQAPSRELLHAKELLGKVKSHVRKRRRKATLKKAVKKRKKVAKRKRLAKKRAARKR